MNLENINKKLSISRWLYVLGTILSIVAIFMVVSLHLTGVAVELLSISSVCLSIIVYFVLTA